MTMIKKTYVEAWVNWLSPRKVILSAMPRPLIAIIDIDPTVEQMEMYIIGFRLPYFGAMK